MHMQLRMQLKLEHKSVIINWKWYYVIGINTEYLRNSKLILFVFLFQETRNNKDVTLDYVFFTLQDY